MTPPTHVNDRLLPTDDLVRRADAAIQHAREAIGKHRAIERAFHDCHRAVSIFDEWERFVRNSDEHHRAKHTRG